MSVASIKTITENHPRLWLGSLLGLIALVTWVACALLGCPWRLALFWALFAPSIGLWVLKGRQLAGRPIACFVAIAAPLGLLYCCFMPAIVSVSWDGYAHYRSAAAIAAGQERLLSVGELTNFDPDGIYNVGPFPWGTSEDDWSANWSTIQQDGNLDRAQAYMDRWDQVTFPQEESPETSLQPTRLPNALGLALAQACGAPLSVQLFYGRLTNMIAYIALMALAMSRLVSGRRILLVFGLTPTLLFMAANYSYDPCAIALLSLAGASFAKELQTPHEPLSLGRAAWILAPWVIGTYTKAVFLPAALLFLFMPRCKFKRPRDRVLWIGAATLCVVGLLASFVVPYLFDNASIAPDTRGGSTSIDSLGQLRFILEHLWAYPLILLASFINVFTPFQLFANLFINFCYLPIPSGWPLFSAAFIGCLAWSVVADRTQADDFGAQPRYRWSLFIGIFLGFCLMATALYLNYTNLGAPLVLGLQVRYLLFEMGPFLLICLNFGSGPATHLAQKARSWAGARAAAAAPLALSGIMAALSWAIFISGFVMRL
ncbi:DUF2142 domain-containing protein [Leptogranulimonas caecicola]|uniref:DUF2142 domain-containing protein n=1 Tax=Leptogranulimonas caecicola TaxID=2894156 RepID=A0AAU9CA31_9ACTN|nr:DUF2142 domain-containing protein [Leptogranulimonas caecicola]BCV18394.1 hypothetical protein ATOBIA_N06840 [Atopobiaceae bacterium P1]BDC90742.1 hypothetical protein ATTO_06140 [Leptogranulimonas caecicola]